MTSDGIKLGWLVEKTVKQNISQIMICFAVTHDNIVKNYTYVTIV